MKRALADKERGLGSYCAIEALRHLAITSDRDACKCSQCAGNRGACTTQADKKHVVHFDLKVAEESIQKKAVVYDGDGDQHYDTISAFIKSMRGSDPDAAIYWLAKTSMREDIRFGRAVASQFARARRGDG